MRQSDFVNQSYNCRPNWTPLSPSTTIYLCQELSSQVFDSILHKDKYTVVGNIDKMNQTADGDSTAPLNHLRWGINFIKLDTNIPPGQYHAQGIRRRRKSAKREKKRKDLTSIFSFPHLTPLRLRSMNPPRFLFSYAR